jgi:hypothetical protein
VGSAFGVTHTDAHHIIGLMILQLGYLVLIILILLLKD